MRLPVLIIASLGCLGAFAMPIGLRIGVWESMPGEADSGVLQISAFGRVFETGGDLTWSFDGGVLRSGNVSDGGVSWVETTVDGAGEVEFLWKASSEINPGSKLDYVSFLVDGEERSWLGGEKDWTNEVFAVVGEGPHTLKWIYRKNINGLTQGEDCAWLDEVAWTPHSPIPPVAADASPEAVTNAIESSGFADADGVKAAIGGSAAEYAAFKEWAGGVKGSGSASAAAAGEAAVVANTNAAAAYLLGAERLFENAPKVEFEELALGAQGTEEAKGTMTVAVTVKDGEESVACSAEKVKAMFEATGNLRDWTGDAKLPVEVEVIGTSPMRFKVTPGDGSAPSAFLRIR